MAHPTSLVSAEEKLAHGFASDDEICMPLPVDEDDDVDDGLIASSPEDPGSRSSRSQQIEDVLQRLAEGAIADPLPAQLTSAAFWEELGREEGLHVCCSAPAELAQLQWRGSIGEPSTAGLRQSLDDRGYLHHKESLADPRLLHRLRSMLGRLEEHGYAPAFLYVFDEAWDLLQSCWLTAAHVLAPESSPQDTTVLEPTFFAHALSRPGGREEDPTSIVRFSYPGGNFGTPHRDHASSDCFSPSGAPTMLSLWMPLSEVVADNGCMFVLPKEFDPLLDKPQHPLHLTPYDQHSNRCNFKLAAAAPLAPCHAGSLLAWHGCSIHWGGACSRYTEAEPRSSLTAAVRLRHSAPTQLQRGQSLPAIEWQHLPLSLPLRMRYIASSLLIYRYWFGLGHGILPADIVPEAP